MVRVYVVYDGVSDKGPCWAGRGQVEVCFQPGQAYCLVSGWDIEQGKAPFIFGSVQMLQAKWWRGS